jgi:hypothetical protein
LIIGPGGGDGGIVAVGMAVGIAVGMAVGIAVGMAVGIAVGVAVGVAVGMAGGIAVGVAVGVGVAAAVGLQSNAKSCFARSFSGTTLTGHSFVKQPGIERVTH